MGGTHWVTGPSGNTEHYNPSSIISVALSGFMQTSLRPRRRQSQPCHRYTEAGQRADHTEPSRSRDSAARQAEDKPPPPGPLGQCGLQTQAVPFANSGLSSTHAWKMELNFSIQGRWAVTMPAHGPQGSHSCHTCWVVHDEWRLQGKPGFLR